jgi:type III secretion protein J
MGRWGLALTATLALAVTACSTNILSGVDERGANDASRALERAGIAAEKVAEDGAAGGATRFTLRVARGDGARALDLLRALGLPRAQRHGLAETYAQPSLIPTPSEERARYVAALAGELERTLEEVDGVVNARVHLVPEEPDALDAKPRAPARAAVLLTTRPGRTAIAEEDVERLVAGSVAGLEPAAVAVVVTVAPLTTSADASPAVASVGPLRVTPSSRGLLVGAIAAGLALLGLLAGLLLVATRRLAALERGVPPASP